MPAAGRPSQASLAESRLLVTVTRAAGLGLGDSDSDSGQTRTRRKADWPGADIAAAISAAESGLEPQMSNLSGPAGRNSGPGGPNLRVGSPGHLRAGAGPEIMGALGQE